MHPINRRQLGWNLGRALGAAALASAGLGARAQTGTPRILVGFPAGGGTDAFARPLATQFSKLTGKALVVAYSRNIAMRMYEKFLELRPQWTDKMHVVMTSSNQDPEEWHKIIGNKAHKAELAKEFKDDDSPFKIAIVVDMWLTGFDVPELDTDRKSVV